MSPRQFHETRGRPAEHRRAQSTKTVRRTFSFKPLAQPTPVNDSRWLDLTDLQTAAEAKRATTPKAGDTGPKILRQYVSSSGPGQTQQKTKARTTAQLR
jgi:hypothetical protein